MSDSFIIYTSYLKIFEQLTDAQLGQLTRHMLSFAKTGKEPFIEDPLVKLSFAFIKDDMERNQRKYEEKCERLRANARKRWDKKQLDSEASEDMQKHTNVCKSMQMHANAQIAMHNDNEYVNDNVYDNDVSKETDNKPSKEGIQSASVSCSKIFKYDVYMINESLMMFYSDNDSFFSSFRLSTVAIRILFRWLVSVGAVTFPPREI